MVLKGKGMKCINFECRDRNSCRYVDCAELCLCHRTHLLEPKSQDDEVYAKKYKEFKKAS